MAAISSLVAPERHTVFWEDIRRVDATRCPTDIFAVIMRYLETRPALGFADIELLLRRDRCYTHLIAKAADPNYKLYPPFFRTIAKVYSLYVIMTTPDKAKKERIYYAGTEEENLLRLREETGVYVVDTTAEDRISRALSET
ncbi:MAG: hypothetical protein JSR76_04260 [Verrucomicrobia bacterium]|nr:hypothetical protein [Verrucomicrobiota bacterium]